MVNPALDAGCGRELGGPAICSVLGLQFAVFDGGEDDKGLSTFTVDDGGLDR